jgi:hypothetical protein
MSMMRRTRERTGQGSRGSTAEKERRFRMRAREETCGIQEGTQEGGTRREGKDQEENQEEQEVPKKEDRGEPQEGQERIRWETR